MKLLNNKKYLFYSFTGWVFLYLAILSLDKISYRIKTTTPESITQIKYYIVEGISCGTLAFFVSLILLYYIDTKKNYSKITRKEIIALSAIFIITQILYNTFIWIILDYWYVYFIKKELTLSFINKLTNIPFFATTFIIWLFITFAIKFITYIKQVTIKQLDLENSLKSSQLNTLKGQINPHFMFNTLNNIRGLILENPSKSREMITRLSEMLRYTLTKDKLNAIALEEELETVENYIAISKIQLENRLQFHKNINVSSTNIHIPPMLLQILVENAIKHGIATLKNGGHINLNIHSTSNTLHIEVINDGKIISNPNSTKLGLENIKQRLFILYKDKASFNLQETNNKVIASIKIPLHNTKKTP